MAKGVEAPWKSTQPFVVRADAGSRQFLLEAKGGMGNPKLGGLLFVSHTISAPN